MRCFATPFICNDNKQFYVIFYLCTLDCYNVNFYLGCFTFLYAVFSTPLSVMTTRLSLLSPVLFEFSYVLLLLVFRFSLSIIFLTHPFKVRCMQL